MAAPTRHIELDRAVESIEIGRRHRTDLGDLDALTASIDHYGLLQPPTITPDGVLVCGRRRLAAIRRLGWRTVSVWVRSGISDRLGHLLAEQDDNVLHKDLTASEAFALYRELKTLMAEDARRRKAATQFSSQHQPGIDGPGKFPGPSTSLGDAREQAAAMIPGSASYKTLDKVGYLRQLADDPGIGEPLRAETRAELERIDAGAPVDPAYQRLRAAAEDHRAEELEQLADDAVARVTTFEAVTTRKKPTRMTRAGAGGADRWPVRAFVQTWSGLVAWWTHYDPAELATKLTAEQIASFLDTAEGTYRFAGQLRAALTTSDQTAGNGEDSETTEGEPAPGPLRLL
ncbi:ParB N-terminal domain-containing protein [Aeromicrobium piscarium]|uniref:Chromosome partitioning protein ParB n=1 Tax=Aeromicrobium piscarium TaxID=2590901 RepID=A0A554S7V7_9ACTN|nr:ParB N-terminal domain-containing protein [Aeromicrobium piscarium]TSD62433.1 chromosome partitioning protein ParB [Aeromicrobium piscarium]